mmetsp:Transcript_64981/g.152916  ORF Transcript_64981/g.152916 Transcript_64981/m.152916 type:complete len:293 (-) Transcript_64981:154-1032(-)
MHGASQGVRKFPTLLGGARLEKAGHGLPAAASRTWESKEKHAKPEKLPDSPKFEEPAGVDAEAGKGEELLDKEGALLLQTDLMMAFSQPGFQKQLHEVARMPTFREDFLKLVRGVQLEIIPRYGFEKSRSGVEKMLQAFQVFEDDPDIQCNNAAVSDLLSVELPPLVEDLANRVVERPGTKHRIMDMIRVQLVEFSKATFQAQVAELKKAVNQPEADFYHLPGRAELALTIQEVLLPHYGFEGSKSGVLEMLRCCIPFLQDPDVAGLLDQVNERLGMSPAACKRFRILLESL